MKVGVIGPLGHDSMARNIVDGLSDLGVETVACGPLLNFRGPGPMKQVATLATSANARWEAKAQMVTARDVLEHGCDIVINVQQNLHADPAALLKSGGARLAVWFPDHIANIGRLSMFEAPYDAVFLKDQLFAERMSRTYGVPAHYLPEACNPRHHRIVADYGTERHIVVVGNIYPTRGRLLRRLISDGVPVRIYGGRLPRSGHFDDLLAFHAGHEVTELEKSRVFRSAAGVLNNLHPAEMTSVNCRLFEAAAAGAVVLAEQRAGLEDLFTPGSEVLTFGDYDTLLEQCRTLVSGPDWGVAMGDRAAQRAHAEHTYGHRLRSILDILV